VPEFRYTMAGRWWKGNTHVHSTVSDGGKTFCELAELYHAEGYSFLFRTDHWVASEARSDTANYPLLWLDGVELDERDSTGAYYHVVALGSLHDIQKSIGLERAMEAARAQGGMLVLAHPQWTGNTFDDALRWHFDGVEVYNRVCHWLNGKGDGSAYWNAMLAHDPNTLSFSADDAHINPGDPGPNAGWVMVNATECTPNAIFSALREGNFYSSCGPLFESIELDGEKVDIRCSPVRFVRLVGPGWNGDRVGSFDRLVTDASFTVPQSWQYAYLELEDEHGLRAWTNPLFIKK
jgi:hypothetical protein